MCKLGTFALNSRRRRMGFLDGFLSGGHGYTTFAKFQTRKLEGIISLVIFGPFFFAVRSCVGKHGAPPTNEGNFVWLRKSLFFLESIKCLSWHQIFPPPFTGERAAEGDKAPAGK